MRVVVAVETVPGSAMSIAVFFGLIQDLCAWLYQLAACLLRPLTRTAF